MEKRKIKGSKNLKNVPNDVKNSLNKGKSSASNLMESLSINHETLVRNVLNDLNLEYYINPCLKSIHELKNKSSLQCTKVVGKTLLNESNEKKDEKVFELINKHHSDTVRSWATFFIGFDDNLDIEEKLEKIKKIAVDEHFGVRENAWLAVRHSIEENLDKSIEILSEWTIEDNHYLRRFASESTRPRGVWTKHITKLKENPEIGLSILEPLKSDRSRYVQNSVGNWLNDASKTNPDWVKKICKKWKDESNTPETERIIKRGMRTINKASSKLVKNK
jgi:3-methyladenine DNA glycosylase AlkC